MQARTVRKDYSLDNGMPVDILKPKLKCNNLRNDSEAWLPENKLIP